MKTKLTLSIDRRKVAMLRKASARRGKSISELVENLADQLDAQKDEEPTVVAEPGILKWAGYLADKLTPEDFEEDSRGGAELRKTLYYERMQKAAGKHRGRVPSERKCR
jgi:ribosomal protein L29